MSGIPTSNEVRVFLDIVEKLVQFEAQQRYIRGYGALNPSKFSRPEYVKVLKWLECIKGA
jgi:hypothetical protein